MCMPCWTEILRALYLPGTPARFRRDADSHGFAVALHDHLHGLANLHRVQGVGVIIDVLYFLARELDDDVAAFEPRFFSGAATAHAREFHSRDFRRIIRNRSEIRAQILATPRRRVAASD